MHVLKIEGSWPPIVWVFGSDLGVFTSGTNNNAAWTAGGKLIWNNWVVPSGVDSEDNAVNTKQNVT